MHRMAALQRDAQGRGARVVGLVADAGPAREAVAGGGAWPVLGDPSRDVLSALGLWRADAGIATPSLLVFDRFGTERGASPDAMRASA